MPSLKQKPPRHIGYLGSMEAGLSPGYFPGQLTSTRRQNNMTVCSNDFSRGRSPDRPPLKRLLQTLHRPMWAVNQDQKDSIANRQDAYKYCLNAYFFRLSAIRNTIAIANQKADLIQFCVWNASSNATPKKSTNTAKLALRFMFFTIASRLTFQVSEPGRRFSVENQDEGILPHFLCHKRGMRKGVCCLYCR